MISPIKFVDSCSKTWCDTFRSVLVYGKEQESREKLYFITVQKKFFFLRRFDRRNTFFRYREI